ncbi:hypothetical protein LTR08_003240 [Meristemomyces frigidus]|nr:hypothetical protein LTR08_003240 [Meristemomyces frigidus]
MYDIRSLGHRRQRSGGHAELRIAIYEATLLHPHPNLALLRACRQIAMEAQPTLYQRPFTFASQATLFAFLARSRSVNLKRVRTLTLRLTDIDLSALLLDGTRQTRTSVWRLYQEQLERLDQALASLPSVAELTVTPPRASRSQLLRGLYLSFLALIPRRYPHLKRLVVDDEEELLESVPGLRGLEDVCFGVASGEQRDAPRRRRDSVTSLPQDGVKHS